jgi:hypothetical protein
VTHEEAILKILLDQNLTKHDLGTRCGYAGNPGSSVNTRLKADTQISNLRKMANALGYEIVMQPIPQDPAARPADQLVLDGIPSEQPIAKRGPGRPRKNAAQNKQSAPAEGQPEQSITVKIESPQPTIDPTVQRLPNGDYLIKFSPVVSDQTPEEESPAVAPKPRPLTLLGIIRTRLSATTRNK